MKIFRLSSVVLFACAAVCLGQSQPPKPAPMPPDRAAASYAIYSSLMPIGETAGKGWPHDFWIVRDATVTVVQPGQPCRPPPSDAHNAFQNLMNPHLAVHPPADRRKDFAEILEDFDAHCHDILALDQDLFQTTTPVHLLTSVEQEWYRESRSSRTPQPDLAGKFAGAPALYGFSEVWFNQNHTVALVYATLWCGGLCGQQLWFAFALENGQWKPLPRKATMSIS